jgi:hypothetical protein
VIRGRRSLPHNLLGFVDLEAPARAYCTNKLRQEELDASTALTPIGELKRLAERSKYALAVVRRRRSIPH